MVKIPTKFHDLLADETRAFAFLGTVMEDGSPQVTPLWFNYLDGHILINSALGRVKDRNMRARRKVSLAIADPKNPYRYLQVRGEVIEITEEGGAEHIHALSRKYRGKNYPLKDGEVRVIYRVEPKKISSMG